MHVQNMVLSAEAEVKPGSPAQVVCLIEGSLLKGATLTQCISYKILHTAKGTAVPFPPWGSVTLLLHVKPLEHVWG